ncbi:MAG: hypothetical protein JNK11_19655 [Alphaproteobacteria bacterium]|nr:hypothetical protein [Alphaproteobacteria bacterium]
MAAALALAFAIGARDGKAGPLDDEILGLPPVIAAQSDAVRRLAEASDLGSAERQAHVERQASQALAQADASGDGGARAVVRAIAGEVFRRLGREDEARRLAAEAVALADVLPAEQRPLSPHILRARLAADGDVGAILDQAWSLASQPGRAPALAGRRSLILWHVEELIRRAEERRGANQIQEALRLRERALAAWDRPGAAGLKDELRPEFAATLRGLAALREQVEAPGSRAAARDLYASAVAAWPKPPEPDQPAEVAGFTHGVLDLAAFHLREDDPGRALAEVDRVLSAFDRARAAAVVDSALEEGMSSFADGLAATGDVAMREPDPPSASAALDRFTAAARIVAVIGRADAAARKRLLVLHAKRGEALLVLNRLAEAEPLLEDVMRAAEDAVVAPELEEGAPAPDVVADAVNALRTVYEASGRAPAARSLLARHDGAKRLAIAEDARDEAAVVQALADIAAAMLEEGRPQPAIVLLKRAVATAEKSLGADSQEAFAALAALARGEASAARLDGKPLRASDPSLRTYHALVDRQTRALGPTAPALHRTLLEMSGYLQPAEALQILERAVAHAAPPPAAAPEPGGPPDGYTLWTEIAKLRIQQRDLAGAAQAIAAAEGALPVVGASDPRRAALLVERARLSARGGRLKEALPLYETAYDILWPMPARRPNAQTRALALSTAEEYAALLNRMANGAAGTRTRALKGRADDILRRMDPVR